MPYPTHEMGPCSEPVTRSRFERRLAPGEFDQVIRVAFGTYAAAARALRVSKMTIWRWCHDRAPLPVWAADVLAEPVQHEVEQAHAAKDWLREFRARPPRPPRPLSGCCAGRGRVQKGLLSLGRV